MAKMTALDKKISREIFSRMRPNTDSLESATDQMAQMFVWIMQRFGFEYGYVDILPYQGMLEIMLENAKKNLGENAEKSRVYAELKWLLDEMGKDLWVDDEEPED